MLLVSFLSSLGRSFRCGAVRRRSRWSAGERQNGLVSASERLETRALLVVTIGATNVDALLTDVDGDGLADPGDTLQHTVTITNSGNMDATGVTLNDNEDSHTTLVGGSIQITPIAFDDAYSLTGNTPITIGAGSGVLANDIDPDSSTPLSNVGLTAVSLNVTGTMGSVSLNTNGSFTYTPATGFNGTDTFQYTARDATSLDSLVTGTVTMTVSGMVWYVDNSAPGGGDGSLTLPFTSLTPLNGAGDADAAGHTIFVFESGSSYSTGFELENSQILIGESAGLSINGTTIGGSGSAPTISRSSSPTITLATSNDLRGLNVTNSNGSGITGTAVGTLLLSNLSATVTGGTALSLTTSGTVSSSGTNNLTSTNGTALNVSDVTIAAAGLTFRSISSGSGAGSAGVGINLVNTGSSGGLTVTGTGSAGTGGTIQNKTGADGSTTAGIGIFLNNTQNVALNWMQLNDFDNFAIRGTSVTNFSLIDSIVNGTHGVGAVAANDEGALSFLNLLGSSAITRSTVANTTSGGGAEGVVRIVNTSGTLDRLTIDNSTIANSNSVAGVGDDGMYFESQNSAVMKLTISNSHFTAARADLIQTNALNSSTMDIVVTNTEFKNNNAAILSGGGGTLFSGGGTGSTATVTFNITGNTFRDSRGHALGVFKGTGTSNFSGTISNNTIGVAGVANSGTLDSSADISVESLGAGTMTVLISGNTLRQYNEEGIRLAANTGDSVLNATVIGNTVTEPGNIGAFSGVYASVGGVGGDTATINLLLGSFGPPADQNSLVGSDPFNTNDVYLENQGATTTLNLSRGGSAAGTVTGVVQDDNVGNPTVGTAGTITLVAGSPPLPLLAAPGGVSSSTAVTLTSDAESVSPDESVVIAPGSFVSSTTHALSAAELNSVVQAAMNRWAANGLSDGQLAVLQAAVFEVSAMSGWYLGSASGNRIQIDSDAAGFGWFLDNSPLDDSEFGNSETPTRLYTTPSQAPAGHIDLLTTVMHEMGHLLGLEDSYQLGDRNSLMYGFATVGERRLPTYGQADGAVSHSIESEEYLIGPLNLGTLPAGKTVAVIFNVSINNLTNGLAPTLSNQGTVSGSNFANVLTDDPAVGGAADPTNTTLDSLTLGNQVWIDADSNSVFNSGTDVGPNAVALTLFLSDGTTVVTTGSTNGSGVYQFTGLLPGDYIVRVDASNFGAAQPLNGLVSITGAVDPDDNVDNDDNGVDNAAPATNGIRSLAITLAYNTEPAAGLGNDTNNTLDLGFTVATAHTPSVTNASTNEDVQSTSGLVISRNVSDGAEVTHFKITSITGGSLFQNDGTTAISDNEFITFAQANAGLKFTPSLNSNVTGQFTVQASLSNVDGGLGGSTVTADITISPIGDTPSVTNASTLANTQTTSGLVISRNAVDGAEVTHFKITNINGGSLFQNDGTTAISNTDFITFAQGNAGLKFTPALNSGATGHFTVRASTSNLNAGLGGAAVTANITVTIPVPVITAPPAVTPFQRPTITWTAVNGATQYQVWIRNASTNVNPFLVTTRQFNAFYPTSDFGIGRYNLWVKAISATGQTSVDTPQYNFQINTAAVFTAMNPIQTTATPTLNWVALPGAVKYDVWIDNLSTGQSQFVRNMNVVGTSFIPPSNLPMGSYRAWVRGVDASGTAATWAVPVNFRVLLPVTVPAAAPSTFDRTPTFTWNAVPGAFGYNLIVRNANTGVTVLVPTGITGTSFTPMTNLPVNPYRWQVTAVATSGLQSQSATVQELYVGGRLTLLTPSGLTSDTTPTFTWTPVTDAVTYEVFVTRADVLTAGIINSTGLVGTSFTPVTPLPVGTYRAWVRAISTTAEIGPWSLQVNFMVTVNSGEPDSLVLLNETLLAGLTMPQLKGLAATSGAEPQDAGPGMHQPDVVRTNSSPTLEPGSSLNPVERQTGPADPRADQTLAVLSPMVRLASGMDDNETAIDAMMAESVHRDSLMWNL